VSDFEHETERPVTEYGQWRREQRDAHLRASADDMMAMLSGAGQADHQAAHDHLTRGQHGIFGAMTGNQLAQDAAGRQATVGGEWGLGRPLERNGHLAQSIAPAPARVDLTRVNDHPGFMRGQEPGVSPLLAHMRGQQ
jgi:hypothetical protein